MKKPLLGLAVLCCGVLLWLVWRPGATGTFHATPEECVLAYFRAVKAADAEAYRGCLEPDFRGEVHRQFSTPEALAGYLRAQGQDLHSLTFVGEPAIDGDHATVEVDQVFSGGQRRQKVLLQKIGQSWHISGLEKAHDIPSDVPYGTHISQVP